MAFMASTVDIKESHIKMKEMCIEIVLKRLTGSSELDGFHHKVTGLGHFIFTPLSQCWRFSFWILSCHFRAKSPKL